MPGEAASGLHIDAACIDRAITAALAGTGIPGAVAIVGDGAGTQFAAAYGRRDLTGDAPMQVDTIFQLASMTKAIVSVAAMQLVERGALTLDAPLRDLLPDFAALQVLDGFDGAGMPVLRAPARPVTLRHLLTHTAGFGYDFVSADLLRARGPGGPPPPYTRASIVGPLLFDPGERWEYGVNTDWVGLVVEAASGQRLDAYVRDHITAPLGMADTMFHLDAARTARLAAISARTPDGLVPYPIAIGGPPDAELLSGGGGLSGTAADYLRFLQMLLGGGSLDGARILEPESVAAMSRNQIGTLRAGVMTSTMPQFSLPIDLFPGMATQWGLGFAINPDPGPDGRAAGALAWAGIANTYYWIDPANGIAAVLLMQLLPFGDPAAQAVYAAFERAVYRPT